MEMQMETGETMQDQEIRFTVVAGPAGRGVVEGLRGSVERAWSAALREAARLVLAGAPVEGAVRITVDDREVLVHDPARTADGAVDRERLLDEFAEAYQAALLPALREMIDPDIPIPEER